MFGGILFSRSYGIVTLLISCCWQTTLSWVSNPRSAGSKLAGGHGVEEGSAPSGVDGYFGCRFSDSVCRENEMCVDDNLFGSCQMVGSPVDRYQYSLKEDEVYKLENEISQLIQNGYHWKDLYTQCVIGNLLLAFELNQNYDPEFCIRKHVVQKKNDFSSRDAIDRLERYILERDGYGLTEEKHIENNRGWEHADYDNDLVGNNDLRENYNEVYPFEKFKEFRKREDFVQVHKYQKQKDRKRVNYYPIFKGRRSSYVSDEPRESEGRPGYDLLYELNRGEQRSNTDTADEDYLMPVNQDIISRDRNTYDDDYSTLVSQNKLSQNQDQLDDYVTSDSQGDSSKFRDSPDGDYVTPDDQDDSNPTEESLDGDYLSPENLLERDVQKEYEDSSDLDYNPGYETAGGNENIRTLFTSRADKRNEDFNENDNHRAGFSWRDPQGEQQDPDVDQDEVRNQGMPEGGRDIDQDYNILTSQIDSIIQDPVSSDNRLLQSPPPSSEELRSPTDLLFENKRLPKNIAGEVVDNTNIDRSTALVPSMKPTEKYEIIDANYAYLSIDPKTDNAESAGEIVVELQELLKLPMGSFSDLSVYKGVINFRINPNPEALNASSVAELAREPGACCQMTDVDPRCGHAVNGHSMASCRHPIIQKCWIDKTTWRFIICLPCLDGSLSDKIHNVTGFYITDAGVGHVSESFVSIDEVNFKENRYFLLTFVLCGVIAGVVLAVILLYIVRRHLTLKKKMKQLSQPNDAGLEASKDYQELCRQHMLSKMSEKPEPLHTIVGRVGSVSAMDSAAVHSPSSRSSTSSWCEEPVATSMDITTGHIVLSYMEDHMKNKDRLDEEWDGMSCYEPEVCATTVATLPQNEKKNRYSDVLPYDHSRVVLRSAVNMLGSDYINATTITDHDPRNPAYIITQGPLSNTVADFWQMVWEQGTVVIVNLTKLVDNGTQLCHCYWPSEGSDLYHIYEVHLVSEHIWCEDYLVRSFYLKNLQTSETRTVTQFHFLTWSDMKIPASSKALLDFRRKVNKSYRGRSCPILVHCSDGAGRSGTYCLIDMVLNRLTKGAKEIDIAATLEHIRDQRMQLVKTKEQFQFVLTTVAEEVHAILKALPQ